MPRREAARRADTMLQDIWIGRDSLIFALPPSRMALEPGDLVRLDSDGRPRLHLVTRIADAGERILEARRIEPACFDAAAAARRPGGYSPVAPNSVADIVLLDLPTVAGHDGTLLWLAATAEPWPGGLALCARPTARASRSTAGWPGRRPLRL